MPDNSILEFAKGIIESSQRQEAPKKHTVSPELLAWATEIMRGPKQDRFVLTPEERQQILGDEKPGILDYAANILSRTVTGAVDTVGSAIQGIDPTINNIGRAIGLPSDVEAEDMLPYQIGKGMRDVARDVLPGDPRLDESFWATKVPSGIGSTAGFLGASVAGGPVAAAAMGSLAEAGSQYEAAKEAKVSEKDALTASAWGLPIGATEFVNVGRWAKLIRRADKATGGAATKAILTFRKQAAVGAGEEFLQEFFQTSAGNAIAKKIYAKDRGWFDGALEAGLVGAVVGGAGGAIESLAPRAAEAARAPERPTLAPELVGQEREAMVADAPEDTSQVRQIDENTFILPGTPKAPEGGSIVTKPFEPTKEYAAEWSKAHPDRAEELVAALNRAKARQRAGKKGGTVSHTDFEGAGFPRSAVRTTAAERMQFAEYVAEASPQEQAEEVAQQEDAENAPASYAALMADDQGKEPSGKKVAPEGPETRQDEGGAELGDLIPEPQPPGEAKSFAIVAPTRTPMHGPTRADLEPDPALGEKIKPIGSQEVIARFRDIWGVTIRFGKEEKGAAGQYEGVHQRGPAAQMMRLAARFASDMGVLAHETAHHIDRLLRIEPGGKQWLLGSKMRPSQAALTELRNLDYDQSKKRTYEGWAEYMRYRLSYGYAEAAQKAPNFTTEFDAFLDSRPDLKEKIKQSKELIDRYRYQGAIATFDATIQQTSNAHRTWSQAIGHAFRKFFRATGDDKYRMYLAQSQAEMLLAGKGKTLKASERAADIGYASIYGAGAFAHRAWSTGPVLLSTGDAIGPGIVDSMRDLDAAHGPLNRRQFKTLSDYMAAREMWEREKEGRASAPLPEQQRALIEYGDKQPGWAAFAQAFTQFHKNLIRVLADAGGIEAKQADAIIDSRPSYVPLIQIQEDREIGDPIMKRLTNKEEETVATALVDPLAITLQMTESIYQHALDAFVGRSLVSLAKSAEGMGWVATEIAFDSKAVQFTLRQIKQQMEEAKPGSTQGMDDNTLFTIYKKQYRYHKSVPWAVVADENGKLHLYEFDKEIYEEWRRFGTIHPPANLEWMWTGFRLGATGVRMGGTQLVVGFNLISNPLRDFQTGAVRTGHKNWLPRYLRGFYTVVYQEARKLAGKPATDPFWELYTQMGGRQATFPAHDVPAMYRTVMDYYRTSQGKAWMNMFSSPRTFIESLAEGLGTLEMAPRLPEFRSELEAMGWTKEKMKYGQRPTPAEVMVAFQRAQEVTTPFRRAGTVGRFVNLAKAFTNASIQDLIQDWRVFAAHPARTIIRGTAWLTVPQLALWFLTKDEDWYEELEPWRRFGFFNFSKDLRFPIPFTLGFLFAKIPEALVDSAYRMFKKDDPATANDRIKELIGIAVDNYVPSPMDMWPDIFLPAVEATYNTKSFPRGQPIVPQDLMRKEKKQYQFDENTTPLAKQLGWMLNQSPMMIDHIANGYSGGMYKAIAGFKNEGFSRLLGIKRIYATTRTKSTTDFYEAKDELQKEVTAKEKHGESINPGTEEKFRRITMLDSWMSEARKILAETKDPEERAKIQNYRTGVARLGLNKPPLESFPLPFDATDLPEELRVETDKIIHSRWLAATDTPVPEQGRMEPRDKYNARRKKRVDDIRSAVSDLDAMGLDDKELSAALSRHRRSKGMDISGAGFQARMLRYRAESRKLSREKKKESQESDAK